jgi:hypothetical protein
MHSCAPPPPTVAQVRFDEEDFCAGQWEACRVEGELTGAANFFRVRWNTDSPGEHPGGSTTTRVLCV